MAWTIRNKPIILSRPLLPARQSTLPIPWARGEALTTGKRRSHAVHKDHAHSPRGEAGGRRRPRAHAERRRESQSLDPDRMETSQRAGRSVQSSRRRLAKAAACEAEEPVRLRIGELAAETDACAACGRAQSPDQDFPQGSGARAGGGGQGGRRPGSYFLATRGHPRDRRPDPGSADGVPQRWPGHVYDFVWVFDLQPSGAWSFEQVPELVLPDDSETPIALDA